MLSKKELKSILAVDFPSSVPRLTYVEKIFSWMGRKEIVIIKGIRRCGKTHIVYQLIEKLPKYNTFYANFDDFRFDKCLKGHIFCASHFLYCPTTIHNLIKLSS